MMNEINIVITNVSVLKSIDEPSRKYVDESGNEFVAKMTNEAPLKSVAKNLEVSGKHLDVILYIQSERVKECVAGNNENGISHIELLQESMQDVIRLHGSDEIYIDIVDEPDEDQVAKATFDVYEKLAEYAKKVDGLNIYIEANGGIRYVLNMLLSVVNTLENEYPDRVHIKKILSMVLGQEPINIINTKSIYETVRLPSIVEEYIHYGRVEGLSNYFEGMHEKLGTEEENDAKKVMAGLKELSDNIQLCRTARILELFYGTCNIGNEIKAYIEKYSTSTNAAVKNYTFLLSGILKQFDIIYRDMDDIVKRPVVYLPRVIEWCQSKSFYQQALTLCSERIPNYLFEVGVVSMSDYMEKLIVKELKEQPYEKYYYFFANIDKFRSYGERAEIELIKKELKNDNKGKQFFGKLEDTSIDLPKSMKPHRDIVSDIIKLRLNEAIFNPTINEDTLIRIFRSCGFNEELLKCEIRVSTNVRATMKNILRGKTDEGVDHSNIKSMDDRFNKIVITLIEYRLHKENSIKIGEWKKHFDEIVAALNLDEDKMGLITERYKEQLCNKYYIKGLWEDGHLHIKDDLTADDLYKILLLYGLCKEQRNFSNHANVSQKDADAAMTAVEINKLICKTLEYLDI